MSKLSFRARRLVLNERDLNLFTRLFENRAMSQKQIHSEIFVESSRQAASQRLRKLQKYGYLERSVIVDGLGRDISVYLNTPKAVHKVKTHYPHQITSDLCKSDSVEHDVKLVELRRKLESFASVTKYYTENVLQACEEFIRIETIEPFVRYYTDGVVELEKSGHKIIVGLEFENSRKALERYRKKLMDYYSNPCVPILLYVCTEMGIRKAVEQAESEIMTDNRPRCFYAMLGDVLNSTGTCTFMSLEGAKITLR